MVKIIVILLKTGYTRGKYHLGSIFEITDVTIWGSDHIEMSSGAQSRVEQTEVINGVSGR